ncbi:MAG TPA: ABC transporter ATP-binding protein [Clostridiaceae bacterium]|jgi:ATP-binding cassette subfamily B multidrug efflux pump|nr:ABC transporter ATP-binding protein [Clostridiaceae bacterium]
MKKFRHISDFIAENKYRYLIGIMSLLATDGAQLILPRLYGKITDLLKEGGISKGGLLYYILLVCLLSFGIAVFRFLWRYLVLGASRNIESKLRRRFYDHLQTLSLNYYNNHKTGDLMAHATNDIAQIREAFGIGIIMIVDSLVIPVIAVVMMFTTAGIKLSLISILPLLFLGLVIVFFVKEMHSRYHNMQEAFSQLTETARENFSGIRVIKSFAQELKEIYKFEKVNRHNKEMNLRLIRIMRLLFPFIMGISALSTAIALWYGGIMVMYAEISLGDFVAFTGYLAMLVWPIASVGWITSMIQRGTVSIERINNILDEKPEITDAGTDTSIKEIRGAITFNNLTFSYPGNNEPVLKNINIAIEEGKTLAIVGHTGSGKTTLANLIPRLYNTPSGSLLIDGVDIYKIPLKVLRSSIGYVPQDTFLFSATIYENIDFFEGQGPESVERAAKTSMIYDNIMEFPDGFNTFVGERGVNLSGGQKQRIAIARALNRNPKILILDDCLSAVDTYTEEQILKKLKVELQKRTSIIISHRISTIKDADEIIVLHNGEITERGTHDTLLAQKGIYYDLYQKQLLKEELERVE